ncbi:MAG: hypothetical protein EON59_01875 [Alphaproteobacteria bacterium]|nr:MAG: hypothetical protein EON59_01875 [Alphaproteobacteria bacterium]
MIEISTRISDRGGDDQMGMRDSLVPALCETEGDPADSTIQFGQFELFPERRELRRYGTIVRLSGRALQLLTILVQHAGEIIGHRELAGQLWPDGGVDDSSLRAHIAALRRALGNERYILNVLGRGYTFVGRCQRCAAPPRALTGVPAPLRAAQPPNAGLIVGRGDAITLLSGQVVRQRLVSVVGAGGVGKSTVALAVSSQLAPNFANGVCLADLAAVADGSDVAFALASALGIVEHSGEPMRAICDSLDESRMLVVLDNCEHLADAVAVLAERLLASTRAPHLLVTSREALFLQEESVYRLAPLDTSGDEERKADAGAGARFFRECAGRLGAEFDANDDARILNLCRQLDGNPMAIQLAAGHAAQDGLASLEEGLDCLFTPLMPHLVDNLRHRTLDSMLDWSVDRLALNERTVLCRIAVLRGSFTLEWAAEVCSCTRIGPAEVIECILTLSNKSLIIVRYDGAAPRYQLANTTRLYAHRRLARSLEAPGLLRKHALSVIDLCSRADRELLRLPALEWRTRYAEMFDELAAALDWCFSTSGDAMLGIELAAAARFVMCESGRVDEHRGQIMRALRALEMQMRPDTRLEQRLLIALTLLDALFLGDGKQDSAEWARARLLELASGEVTGEQPVVAFQAIAGWGLGQGCYSVVLDMAERIATCAGRSAEPEAAVLANRVRAQGLHFLGNHDEAFALARAALNNAPRRRTAHYLSKVPVPVSMGVLMARTLWIRGKPDEALWIADETLTRAEGNHPHAICMALGLAAIPVALWRGDASRARALTERFSDLVESAGSAFWQPWRATFRYLLQPSAANSAGALLPSNSVLRDMLATFDYALADGSCQRRVREGLVGWNAPEVLRAAGVQRLHADRGERKTAEAAGLFLRARALAREQGAIGWELRAAVSLAELWAGSERGETAMQELAELLTCFEEGYATADLVRARTLLTSTAQGPAASALWCSALLNSN